MQTSLRMPVVQEPDSHVNSVQRKAVGVEAGLSSLGFEDRRPGAVAQRKLAEVIDGGPRVMQQKLVSERIGLTPQVIQQKGRMEGIQHGAEARLNLGGTVQLREGGAEDEEVLQGKFVGDVPVQMVEAPAAVVKPNNTGLPDQLKSGIEALSGMSMDHVRVHYNSDKPAQLQAHAYAQGSEIHIGPGQEKHLPHEAWHVVQQAEGRVRATRQMAGEVEINDDVWLEGEADLMGIRALSNVPQNQRNTMDLSSAPITLLQRRAEDPYELGAVDSPQVHHIIAHSKLKGGIDKLNPDTQGEIKRAFMPELVSITIRQLLNINDRLVAKTTNTEFKVADQQADKNNIFPEMTWLDVPISALDENEITISNSNVRFNNTSLADWKVSYNLVKQNQPPLVGSKADFWDSLQDSYAEWSAGNLFYGAQKRVEPGGSDLDEFDSDAKYFRDPKHVEKMQKLSLDLAAAGNDTGVIKDVLLEIAAQSKDAGSGPKNDRAQWFSAKTEQQKVLIVSLLEPGPRKDFLDKQGNYSYLPVPYVIERINERAFGYCAGKPNVRQTYKVLTYLKRNEAEPTIAGLTFKRTTSKNGVNIRVGVVGGAEVQINDIPSIRMEEMRDLLNKQLQESHINELKIYLGI